MKNFTKVQQTI